MFLDVAHKTFQKPLRFHCIPIFISNLAALFILYNVFVLHTYDWNNIRAVDAHYCFFHSICQHRRFLCTFILNMVSPGNSFTARFLNTTLFFLGLFGKLHSTFLVAFASVLLDLYARLPVVWGGEISCWLLFCLCFCCSIFWFSRCWAFSSVLIFCFWFCWLIFKARSFFYSSYFPSVAFSSTFFGILLLFLVVPLSKKRIYSIKKSTLKTEKCWKKWSSKTLHSIALGLFFVVLSLVRSLY